MSGLFSETADLRHLAHIAACHGDQEGVFRVKNAVGKLASQEGLGREDQERILMVDEIVDIYARIALNPGTVVDLDPDYWDHPVLYEDK
jgi:hypothetical protein